MRSRRHQSEGKSGLVLLAETFHQLRNTPVTLLVTYYAGTVPFVLGTLFFWTDMSHSPFARDHCMPASLGLAALFVWMKCWHTVFACGIRAHVSGLRQTPWTPRRTLRMARTQLALQAHGLWLLPAAILLLFPFHSVYSFFQNMTVFGDGTRTTLRSVIQAAGREAVRWPGQNWVLIWLISPWTLGTAMLLVFGTMRVAMSGLPEFQAMQGAVWFAASLLILFSFLLPLCPFSGAVAGNIAMVLALAPFLARQWFGLESLYTSGGIHTIFNSTFLMTVFALTFLCLDPLVKTAYAIRCFYGESLATGNDLIAELNE